MTGKEGEEIAVLKDQMQRVQKDLTEVKGDIKTIIATLDGNFVTKAEFREYQKAQVWQKTLIALGFLIIGGLTTYFFTNIGK